ncbi:MAG: LuxR C-terminal-related transcriptional regulator [Candidatus Nanopelagicales bacterium]|nr:LuxR C-terminal-related transcriptional regulator [Candidatus Nanopelagicales bacterium]
MTGPPAAAAPTVVGEIERRRALGLLADPPQVVVISAPAGSGKSTLARQWTARGDRAHATVRVTAALDGSAELARAIVDALEPMGPAADETRACITGKEPTFSGTLLPGLTQLAQSRSQPFVLVVDDAHLIRSDSAQQVVAAVCEGTPDGSTTALLTRSQAPDWLARLRTTGRLTELTADDLAFDLDEARDLLAFLGAPVEPPVVAAVVEHTEGWPVGVYLTGLGMRSGSLDLADRVRLTKGSDRAVADYIRTQVLGTLSEDRRRFLIRTSILDELDGPLCDAVLEREDSALILSELHREIQLLIALDGEQPRYRCHHLLAEELSAELHTNAPGEIAGLHERAALWFDANGDLEAAIRHATASGRTETMSRIIWPAVPMCVASGTLDRLRAWLSGISERQLAQDRWLTMAAVWAFLQQGDATAMRRWAALAQEHAGPDWREAARHDAYAATLAVLHGIVGESGIHDTRDLCERALGGLSFNDPFRAAAAFNKGIALSLQGEVGAGMESLLEAEALAQALGVPVIEANAKSWMGLLALDAGERQRAIHLVSEAAEVTRRYHLDRLATGALTMTAQSLVLALVGDKTAAAKALATARRLTVAARGISPWFAVSGRLYQARAAALLGDGATARLLISEARQNMTPQLQASTLGTSLAEADSVLAHMSDHGGAAGVLTTTELRVLQFLPSYLTLQQIAEHLFVSHSTVKTHVLSIYRKFGVGTRSDAVAHARSLGLVEAPLLD